MMSSARGIILMENALLDKKKIPSNQSLNWKKSGRGELN
jgi:hypothetical protein